MKIRKSGSSINLVRTLEILLSIWAGFSTMVLSLGLIFRGFDYLGFAFSEAVGFFLRGFRGNPIWIGIVVGLPLFAWRLIRTKRLSNLLIAIVTGMGGFMIFWYLLIEALVTTHPL